jgi:phosphatidate cytidylyltransferase
MRQRAITAVFFAAAMLGGIYGGLTSFILLFVLVALGCLWELTGILFTPQDDHRLFRRITGMLLGVLPVALYGYKSIFLRDAGEDVFLSNASMTWINLIVVLEILLIFSLFIAELFLSSKHPFACIGHYLTGIVYIGIPYTMLIQIALLTGEYGPHRVFGIIWLVWTNDVMAYLIGSQIGRTKLFERISPKKTWEGSLGGVVSTVLMAWILSRFITEYSPAQWVAVASVAAIFGSLGDLVESMLKRSADIKDSGTLFPGHGGFLDRFDAFQFAIPFAWGALMVI